MRQDKDFQAQYKKEQAVTTWLSSNGMLSILNPSYISDPIIQQRGVDLSCQYNDQPIYIDLKLKNAGKIKDVKPVEPSKSWSVEIAREMHGEIVQGWFVQKNSLTNIYYFLDAYGSDFTNLNKVEITYFSKLSMKNLIERNTGLKLDQIYDKARNMLLIDEKIIKLSIGEDKEMVLFKSYLDDDSPVINLCFYRRVISSIVKSKTIYKK